MHLLGRLKRCLVAVLASVVGPMRHWGCPAARHLKKTPVILRFRSFGELTEVLCCDGYARTVVVSFKSLGLLGAVFPLGRRIHKYGVVGEHHPIVSAA